MSRPKLAAFLSLTCIAVLVLTSPLWLRGMGHLLVVSDGPVPSEAIVVLAGDYKGERVVQACRLAQQHVAPVVLVSGPMTLFGRNEADLAIEFAVAQGCPRSLLQPVYVQASSTEDEAREFERELHRRGFHQVLVLTSNYHSARARRIFQKRVGHDIKINMYAAPDSLFDPDHWWGSREGRKVAYMEWSKTVSGAFGL